MMVQTRFIEGPAGVGKTTAAIQHVRHLLETGARGDEILVLLPQRAPGWPYTRAFTDPEWPPGTSTEVITLGGLARRSLEVFWPLIAERAGVAQPGLDPLFLTVETAQYFMARLVLDAQKTGVFDSISISAFDIMRQTLDNLSKAAVSRIPLDQIADRLTAAWGDRHSSRPPVYRACLDVAHQFRELCLQYSLLDFSLQIEVFMQHLLSEPLFARYLRSRYRHLIADNLEEEFSAAGDFIRWLLPGLDSALLLYDTDGGYRRFLGAAPSEMYTLADLAGEREQWRQPVATLPALAGFADVLATLIAPGPAEDAHAPAGAGGVLTIHSARFFPQMIDWAVAQIVRLIESGVSPREIVVVAPFMSDSLRFALTTRLQERGIAAVSHRPSRALREEPPARVMLTWLALAHPQWGIAPPMQDVADALSRSIAGLDPVRAWLLAQIVYRPHQRELASFDRIEPAMQQRITYVAGQRYERLRAWLDGYRRMDSGNIPPDHFFSRLFGEILSQPDFGFHGDAEAGRIIAELVESARKFRQTLYPAGAPDGWDDVLRDYFTLVQQGLLAALYLTSWRDEQQDAVFLAPAYTFLMRNRWVDYQFWLDVGSSTWWERLEQPLTHPYVLARDYPPRQPWTDQMEVAARDEALRQLAVGLVRRCRRHIYAAIVELGEQGYEQRGPLLRVLQRLRQASLEERS
jgi:hypothetical protein